MSDVEEYSEDEQYEEESEEEPEEDQEEEIDEYDEGDQSSIIDIPNNLIEQIHISNNSARRTPNKLSLFEKTELTSIRIFQIQNNDKIFVPIANLKSADEIAHEELMKKKSPLNINRYVGTKIMPDGKLRKVYETYVVNDMKL